MTSTFNRIAAAPVRDAVGHSAFLVGWLRLVLLLIFAIVIVGGATRLTESGLSITEWELVTGVVPPLTAEQWAVEFEKYRRIPQYTQVNRGMTLAEFQVIYLWEWAHRLLGRVIGLVFAAGFLAALALRLVDRRRAWALFGIGFLIGLQGAVGWWMVTSGLTDRVAVAPYRLAVHLTLACVIFALVAWVLRGFSSARDRMNGTPTVRRTAEALLALIVVQIFLGALVAGTRSGWVYQTWPLIDGGLWPSGMLAMEPWWKNVFENTGTTQFVHRTVAYVLLALACWHALSIRAQNIDPRLQMSAVVLAAAIVVQGAIGVATLWSGMHLVVALSHQAWIVPTLWLAVRHAHMARA